MKKKSIIDLKIALLGKNPIMEDELINEFQNLGIEEKNIISMDDESSQISFDIEDEEARFYLPLEMERIKDLDVIFVLGGLTQGRADFFERAKEKPEIFVFHSEEEKGENLLKNRMGFHYISSPEIFIVSEILRNIKKQKPRNFYWSLYESASSKGKEGIKELYDQTVDVLNFQTPESNVFKSQIAFNLIPRKPELNQNDENEIREKSGYKGILFRNTMYVPLFYLTLISFFTEFDNWEKNSAEEIREVFKKSIFFEFKDDISNLSSSTGYNPSLFIDTDKEKCLFGIVCFDPFKMMVKQAVQSLELEKHRLKKED